MRHISSHWHGIKSIPHRHDSHFLGVVRRRGDSIGPVERPALRDWAARCGCPIEITSEDGAAFLCVEPSYEALRRTPDSQNISLVYARVTNRAELESTLGLSTSQRRTISDSELVTAAYRRWEESAPARISGRWSFVVWNEARRELFMARDHVGHCPIYYYCDDETFAFSTAIEDLLALWIVTPKLDELFLGQVLISWFAYHDERTIHKPIKRLLPAHTLKVTQDRLIQNQYWLPEKASEFKSANRQDYVSRLRTVFESAVREGLRGDDAVGATLSGGLDSGAVTVVLANLLKGAGKRLPAFTSVPIFDVRPYERRHFGDEYELARATAQSAENIDLIKIDATDVSPIKAIREMLTFMKSPGHGANNFYWYLTMCRIAAATGCRTLFVGSGGNATISWAGDVFSQSPFYYFKSRGIRKGLRGIGSRCAPKFIHPAYRRFRESGWSDTAILPEFADRLRLRQLQLEDVSEWRPVSPGKRRLKFLKPGHSLSGEINFAFERAAGIEFYDPTKDPRITEFSLSVPDWVFIDPETNMDRWLIREAMKGQLPDSVRLNRRRGVQSADLVPRLRQYAADVEEALDECARGAAAAYLDVSHMRAVWDTIRTEDTPDAFRLAVTVLTRGIMAGLFVNGFAKTW